MRAAEEPLDVAETLRRELRDLRGCMRDLVAFAGLRALWAGQEPAAIVESFADAVLGMLHAELVFVRLDAAGRANRQEVLRAAAGPLSPERARQVGERLASLCAESVGAPVSVAGLLAPGTLSLAIVPLGPVREIGCVAVGSAQASFPDDLQRALLGIAATQLAVVLKERELFERCRAEYAQRASEERFRSVFEHASVGMAVSSLEGRFLQVNAAMCELTGHTEAELLATDFQSITHPADLPEQLVLIRCMLAGDIPGFVVEKRYLRRDGGIGWGQSSMGFSCDAAGKPTNLVCLAQNVTHRKQTEQALREKTELLQVVFDNIPLMVSIADHPGGRLALVNREWERVLGWTLPELEDVDIFAEAFPDSAAREEALAFNRDLPQEWRDFRIRVRDGRIVDTAWANTVLSDGRVIGIGKVTTDQKRTEAEREQRARQLQGLADAALAIGAASSVAGIADAMTDAARRVIGVDQAVARVTKGGYPAVAISARSLSGESAAGRCGGRGLAPGGSGHDGAPGGEEIDQSVMDSNRPLRQAQRLAVPLVGRDGKNLGVLQLSDKVEGDFGADDEAILVQLAQLASEAVENARLLQEVSLARERLEALSRRLVKLQEEERHAIARELHDEVGQVLTGLTLMLVPRSPGAAVDLTPAHDLAVQLLERVRDLSLQLRPPMLDHLGLVPTLLWHFERYQAQTGIRVRFRNRGVVARLPAGTEITAFRIVQEALTNVARHAAVAEATVELEAAGRSLGLRVEDEGRGFDPLALRGPSSGLTGMRERALLVGGSLTVESRPGAGTRLLAELPLAAPVDA